MYQIIDPKLWAVFVIWITLSTFFVFNNVFLYLEIDLSIRYIVFSVDLIIVAATLKPVWRRLWRYIPLLNEWIFPDINGEYIVELHSNWPVQEKLLEGASGGVSFDPRDPAQPIPEFSKFSLRAKIDMGFYSIKVTMRPDGCDDRSVLEFSRSLSAQLLRPCDGHPHRLVYVYQQKNQRQRQAVTDDSWFEGAAILMIDSATPGHLKGEYWTNRSWQLGLSTAGTISFLRC